MTDATATPEPPPKSSRKWVLIALPLAALLAGGGFYATWSGLLALPDRAPVGKPEATVPVAYVPLRDIVVTLGSRGNSSQLLFSADLEVDAANQRAVSAMTPRFIDVLNSYLRALEPEEIEHPAALVRLRAQMLRRMQIVAGDGLVRDLLIIEFVLR